jgi:predicted RNA-binding Zn-ribbon protein involved in translation (DUF1610 family)
MRLPVWLVVCVLLVTASAVTTAVVLLARKPEKAESIGEADKRRCPDCGHVSPKAAFRDGKYRDGPKAYRCPNCGRNGIPPRAD